MARLNRRLLQVAALTVVVCAPASSFGETLQEIYQQALANDHQFKAAQAAYSAGRENRHLGRAGLLPRINGEANWSDSDTTRTGTEINMVGDPPLLPVNAESGNRSQGYSVALVQPLFDLSAWHNYKRGEALSNIAEARYLSAEQALIVRTARAYFTALQAVDNLETARAEENALSHQLEQTRQRFEVGLTAITEVHEAQAAFDSATATRLVAEGQLGIAFEGLEVITGRANDRLNPLRKNFPVVQPEPLDRDDWVTRALDSNYELRAASLNAEASRRNADAQKAGHLPTLTGSLSYSNMNNRSDAFGLRPDMDTETQAVGLTLRVPIYNGGGVSASRRQANALYLQAREEYNQTQRDIVQQVRSVHLSVVTGVATVKARSQAITSNQSALDATQAGYEVGTRDLVDVLNAQRNLYRAQRDYFDSLYSYILSSLQLHQSAGTLTASNITELNNWLDTSRTVTR